MDREGIHCSWPWDSLDFIISDKRIVIEFSGETFAGLASSLDQSGAKYTVLYISDPLVSNESPYRDLERFLAEGDSGKGLGNSTICDEVCQIKSSLLEGLLVVSSSCLHIWYSAVLCSYICPCSLLSLILSYIFL